MQPLCWEKSRLTIHNQEGMVATRVIAKRNTVGCLSSWVATRLRSFGFPKMIPNHARQADLLSCRVRDLRLACFLTKEADDEEEQV